MGQLTIRDMREQGCAEVSRVVCASFGWAARREGHAPEQIARYFAQRGCREAIREQFTEYRCLVARRGESIVGMAAVKANELTKLYVDPRLHGQGIGRALFAAAERIIRQGGHGELVLGAAFRSCIPFYEAMGMSVADEGRISSGPLEGRPRAYMVKRLGPDGRDGQGAEPDADGPSANAL